MRKHSVKRKHDELVDVFWIFEYMGRFTTMKMEPLLSSGIKCANEDLYHHLSIS